MLRTLGGKNIGKCRLRAHQHPLLPPLPNLRRARPHAKHPKQDASSTRDERLLGDVLGDVLGVRAEDRLLPASILDFKPKLENRCKDFLVSGLLRALILKFKPRLENRCKLFPVYTLLRAVILDLRGSIWESLQGFPTELVVSTVSASDSNLRCGKEEWFRLQRQSRRRSSASGSNLRCRRQEKS